MASTLNEWVVVGVLALLIVATLILLAYGLYQYRLVGSFEASVGVNPYCVREICTSDGSQTSAYQVPPKDDPTRTSYQTPNYCLLNAPPCELISAMATCANPESGDTSSSVSKEDLEQILAYYNQHYYPRCKYEYTGPTVQVNSKDTNANMNVNSPSDINGPNDDFLVSLLSCAKSQGLDTNSDWIELNTTACGKNNVCVK